MSNLIRNCRTSLGVLLWPQDCFVCGGRAGYGPVCADCEPFLAKLPACVCPVCGLPTPVAGMACGRCQRHPPEFDATRAIFVYDARVRDMVLALKHAQGFPLLDWFSGQLAGLIAHSDADVLVATPLHARRLAERGFNQSVELAARVARATRIPLHREAVVRDVDTPKFAGMRSRQRRSAIRGVFRCTEDFSGQHVVVLDDVMTSGATLGEMARTLKQRGARQVTNLVIARTLRQQK